MNADPQQAKAIFLQAMEKHDPDQWPAFLDQACVGQPELRRRVEVLLAAHREAGTAAHQATDESSPLRDAGGLERPGTMIGPYKLLQQIGEGGMGVVWMAEQTQPVQRKVALKVIKPGMDSRQVIARFEAERQALALMDHPNIAKVFDAGTAGVASGEGRGDILATRPSPLATHSGRPYFVMELVRGESITKYCDEHRLTPRQRLDLFVQVCQAIQHAHQKGIIHRDIKASNVLIAPYDGKPVVKVIDFGVAKATGQRLTDKTLFTNFGAVVGTLEYMSPEQAELNNQDIDTRSDIYSLGVLLYELLTGTTPLSRARLKQTPFADLLRVIREEEPPRPSTRLSDSKDSLPSISAQRQMEPAKLTKLVRGELDWIVMKSLEKDRNRRYETANGFAADVQRYLNDEPVLSGPPSALYRLRKFVRRNWAALSMGAVVVAAIIMGSIVATWQAIVARSALARETQQHRRAETNLSLTLKSLDEIYTDLGKAGLVWEPHMEPVRKVYLEKALGFYRDFALANADNPASQLAAVKAELQVAEIEGELGQSEAAHKRLQKVIPAIARLADNRQPEPMKSKWLLAVSHAKLARFLENTGKLKEAKASNDQCLTLFRELNASAVKDVNRVQEFAAVCQQSARVLARLRKLDEAAAAIAQSMESFRWLKETQKDEPVHALNLAACASDQAWFLDLGGKAKEAENAWLEALRLAKEVDERLPNNPTITRRLSYIEQGLGDMLVKRRRYRDAEPHLRHAFAVQRKLAGEHPTIAVYREKLKFTCGKLGDILLYTGRHDEGVALLQQLHKDLGGAPDYGIELMMFHDRAGFYFIGIRKRANADKSFAEALAIGEQLLTQHRNDPNAMRQFALVLNNAGIASAMGGRSGEAEKAFRRAHGLQRELLARFASDSNSNQLRRTDIENVAGVAMFDISNTPDYTQELVATGGNLARLLSEHGKYSEAVAILNEAMKLDPKHASTYNVLAWLRANCLDQKQRDAAQAVTLAKKAVDLAGPSPSAGSYWNTLGIAYCRAKDWRAAVDALTRSMDLRKGGDAYDWFFLAMAHRHLGDKDNARKWYDQAIQWMDRNNPRDEELRSFRTETEEALGLKK